MLVTRYSHKHDIVFRVKKVTESTVLLHGEDLRIEADAPIEDIRILPKDDIRERKAEKKEKFSYRIFRQDYQLMKKKKNTEYKKLESKKIQRFQLPVKVLHIDGDRLYLKKCIDLYQKLGIHVHGLHVKEDELPFEIERIVKKIQPNIIVLTGHDAYSKAKGSKSDLRAYRNSRYFVEAVRKVRGVYPHLDQMIIFAGACQSHFESIIRAGANFASSPGRINIHALDPVYVVAKVAYTPFMDRVNIYEILK